MRRIAAGQASVSLHCQGLLEQHPAITPRFCRHAAP